MPFLDIFSMALLISIPLFSDLQAILFFPLLCIDVNLEPSFILTGVFLSNNRTEPLLFFRDEFILGKNLPRVWKKNFLANFNFGDKVSVRLMMNFPQSTEQYLADTMHLISNYQIHEYRPICRVT